MGKGASVPFNWEGIVVAPTDTVATATPTWTRLDNQATLRVHEVTIRRGRSDEFERTDTGRCAVALHDRDGDVDPTNVDWVSRPLAVAIRNPVADTWHPRFRGTIDEPSYDLHPSMVKGGAVIEASDALESFANAELAPGVYGDVPPAASAGYVYFAATSGDGPQDRIEQVLGNYGWPTVLQSIFTGNVFIPATVYSPGESVLSVIDEAADAELPGVGNRYVDKYGVVSFHGRRSRFDPDAVAAAATHWDFNRFDAGTTVGRAQVRPPLSCRRSRRMIRNVAMAYPFGMDAADRDGQVVQDAASVAVHGPRSWSAENLRVEAGNASGLTGPQECLTYAQYVIDNYADSQVRIDQVTIRSVAPDDPRAAETWALLCEVDLSDVVNVLVGHPGGGGFSADFFVEGITEVIRPLHKDLDTGYPLVEMTLDLSPAAYWTTPPAEWGF